MIVAALVCIFVAAMFPWFRKDIGEYSDILKSKIEEREQIIGQHVLLSNPTTTNSVKTDDWVIGGDNSELISSSIQVQNITFDDGDDYEIRVGDIVYVDAIIFPSNASKKELVWKVISGGEYIIPVKIDSSTIQITGASPGRAVIEANATDGSGTKRYAYINVIQPVNKLTLDKTSVSLSAGSSESTTITATIHPASASEQRVNWSFGNGGIGSECVKMETHGKSITLTALRNCNGQTAKIVATSLDGGYTAEVEINVGP